MQPAERYGRQFRGPLHMQNCYKSAMATRIRVHGRDNHCYKLDLDTRNSVACEILSGMKRKSAHVSPERKKMTLF